MITLLQLPPAFGLPFSVSPYCTKLELYFRLTGHDYEAVNGDIRKSPNKRVPYVRWADGTIRADSADIIAKLEAGGPSLDDGLSEADRARGQRLEALAQERLYYACLYARFVDPAGWQHQKAVIKDLLPAIMAPVLGPVIRKSQIKACRENGFADDSGYGPAVDAVTEISGALGDHDFLLGDQPRTADCAVWANLAHMAATRSDNQGRRAVRDDARLMRYVDRVAQRVDWRVPIQ